ncbi:cytochrome P450 [Streptomyces beihaiensis]|uniref:Cytochrome P450 n=1 Tax=Streptomyces beihaiensis TaxID=2984495 RepID=A0ABT3U6D2_9ACTN|nr:cytochrome P450 [Streptomyces beihaiensis]MCX3063775.1 cytochrome P450 [Streptomyces beihaiensis]
MTTPSCPEPASRCPRPRGATLPDGPRLTAAELHRMENERQLAAWEAYARAYGSIFTLYGGDAPPRVYVSDPAAIRRLFISDRTAWGARGTRYFRPVIGAQALPYLTGDAHRAIRLLLAPPLHGDRVRALGPAVDEIITTELDELRGHRRPLIKLAHDITLRLIVRVAFGALPHQREQHCVRLLIDIMDLMYEPAAASGGGPDGLLRQIDGLVQQVQAFVGQEVTAARGSPDQHRRDLIHHLATGEPAPTDEQIRGHLMTLLIAGHDTTASALAWALYQLELHPGIRRRVHTELDGLGADAAPAAIVKLPYLKAVCAEALRHGSVVPAGLARVVPGAFEWNGHFFPAGTELVPAIHLVHRRPDLYPDPERFDPERFLRRKVSGSHYLPFGTGTRRCPGAELAEFELPLALARLTRTPGLLLTGAAPGLRTVKNGPTMTIPHSLLVSLAPQDGRP